MHVAPPKFVPEVLLLNISKIDDEHEAIFDLLASVKDRYLETGAIPSEQIEHILDTLKEHFATEELLARTANQDFPPMPVNTRNCSARSPGFWK